MKPGIAIAFLLMLCMSCTNNKPLSDAEKQQITAEIKNVASQIFQAAEKADAEAIIKLHYGDLAHDVPDILTPDGKTMTGKEWSETVRNMFSLLTGQKITILSENVSVLDRSTVWYQNVSKALVSFKDSSIVEQNPWSAYFLFRKIDDQWRWIAGTEYGHQEIVKPAPLPKDMNQVELSGQMLGLWKTEIGDTLSIYDQQPFGKAQVVNVRTTVKGKLISEERQLWGFDRIHNRMTVMVANRNGNCMVGSLQYTAPLTYTIFPYENISEPAYARFRVEGEFTNADNYVEKVIMKNEAVRTYTTRRVK